MCFYHPTHCKVVVLCSRPCVNIVLSYLLGWCQSKPTFSAFFLSLHNRFIPALPSPANTFKKKHNADMGAWLRHLCRHLQQLPTEHVSKEVDDVVRTNLKEQHLETMMRPSGVKCQGHIMPSRQHTDALQTSVEQSIRGFKPWNISGINQPGDSGKITNDSDRHTTKVSGIIWTMYCTVHGQRLVFYTNSSTFAKYSFFFLRGAFEHQHHAHICALNMEPPARRGLP